MSATIVKCGCGAKRCEGFENAFVQCASSRSYPVSRFVGTDGRHYNQNAAFFCLTCRRAFKVTEIRGRKNATPCDGRCTHAKGGDCECACAGKNHGAGL